MTITSACVFISSVDHLLQFHLELSYSANHLVSQFVDLSPTSGPATYELTSNNNDDDKNNSLHLSSAYQVPTVILSTWNLLTNLISTTPSIYTSANGAIKRLGNLPKVQS